MNILITAGGTSEPIDHVRSITNHATGSLGTYLVSEIEQQIPNAEIFYIYGPNALLPTPSNQTNIHYYPITTAQDLLSCTKQLCADYNFFAIIHSMAVSDYYVDQYISQEQLIQQLYQSLDNLTTLNELNNQTTFSNWITQSLNQIQPENSKKISSKSPTLWLKMQQNPKIIHYFKKWQPNTHLIGFKLLVDVLEKDLYDIAQTTLQHNQCTLVCANDLTHIQQDRHQALIINDQGIIAKVHNKQEIAKTLITYLAQLS